MSAKCVDYANMIAAPKGSLALDNLDLLRVGYNRRPTFLPVIFQRR
jgi:hypothetical protein